MSGQTENGELQTCRNCYYVFEIATGGTPAGLCRRYPPRVTGHNFSKEVGIYWGCWPTVYLDNWCGEWCGR